MRHSRADFIRAAADGLQSRPDRILQSDFVRLKTNSELAKQGESIELRWANPLNAATDVRASHALDTGEPK